MGIEADTWITGDPNVEQQAVLVEESVQGVQFSRLRWPDSNDIVAAVAVRYASSALCILSVIWRPMNVLAVAIRAGHIGEVTTSSTGLYPNNHSDRELDRKSVV